MPLSKSRPRTVAQRAARRANSWKYTGPKNLLAGKSVDSLNTLKDSRTAQAATRPLRQWMAELGEDPPHHRLITPQG